MGERALSNDEAMSVMYSLLSTSDTCSMEGNRSSVDLGIRAEEKARQ